MSSTPAPDTTETPKPKDYPFLDVIRNPTARTYALVAAGGTIATSVILYLFYFSTFGAVAVFVIGVLGVLSRWSSAPVMFVLATTYFALCPFGVPVEMSSIDQVKGNQFRLSDLMLVATALVHLIGLLRYYTAIHIGMPFDAPQAYIKPGAKPALRPTDGVSDPELWKLFARAGVFVLIGQLVWLGVSVLKFDFRRNFPIYLPTDRVNESGFFTLYSGLSRILLAVLLFTVVGFAVWFVSWYWRLASMSRDEGRLTVIDTQWSEMRRDLNRPEAWRGRMKKKLTGTLPKKGCGTYFLVIGLPAMMILLFVIVIGCAGGFD